MNKFFYILLFLVLTLGFSTFHKYKKTENKINSPENISYNIEGNDIKMTNGFAQIDIPNSSSKITTRYFGNSIDVDLNNDGLMDKAFIITQDSGGSGVFYYAVFAIKNKNGYLGSEGFFIGDRISPQSTSLGKNSENENIVIFNYADRNLNEPFSVTPSLGKSLYLKFDGKNNRFVKSGKL